MVSSNRQIISKWIETLLPYSFSTYGGFEVILTMLTYKLMVDFSNENKYQDIDNRLVRYIKNSNFSVIDGQMDKSKLYNSFSHEMQNMSKDFRFIKSGIKFIEDIPEPILREMVDLLERIQGFDLLIARKQYKQLTNEFIEIIELLDSNIKTQGSMSTTPKIISNIISKILNVKNDESVLDICNGVGALSMEVSKNNLYGIEIDPLKSSIADFLLILSNENGKIINGDCLETEEILECDVVVTQPPFGARKANTYKEKSYHKWGIRSNTSMDMDFLSLAIYKAKSKGAVIVSEGMLFRSGNDGEIRKNMLKDGLIEGIISLPGNIFSYTNIPVNIIIFNKCKLHNKEKVFFLDAKEYFQKLRGRVTISEKKINDIVDIYNKFEKIEGVSDLVSLKKIISNDGILNVIRYIDIIKDKFRDLDEIEVEMKNAWEIAKYNKEICDEKLKEL